VVADNPERRADWDHRPIGGVYVSDGLGWHKVTRRDGPREYGLESVGRLIVTVGSGRSMALEPRAS
jgi:hypothetical protein